MTTTPAMDSVNFYGRLLGGAGLAAGLTFWLCVQVKKWFGQAPVLPLLGLLVMGAAGLWLANAMLLGGDITFIRILLGTSAPVIVQVVGAVIGGLVGIVGGALIQWSQASGKREVLIA